MPEKVDRRAVITNQDVPKAPDKERRAVFDIQAASDAANDWIKTVSKDLERRFGKVDLVKVDGGDGDSPLKDLGRNLKQISPLRVMNEQVKNSIKDMAQANSGKIAATAVEAGLYCAAFHHVKEAAKRHTRGRKCAICQAPLDATSAYPPAFSPE